MIDGSSKMPGLIRTNPAMATVIVVVVVCYATSRVRCTRGCMYNGITTIAKGKGTIEKVG